MFLENFLFPRGKAADFIGTLSRRPIFFDLQSAKFPRGRYEDALASSTEPCGLDVLAVQACLTCSRRIGDELAVGFLGDFCFCLCPLFFIR